MQHKLFLKNPYTDIDNKLFSLQINNLKLILDNFWTADKNN